MRQHKEVKKMRLIDGGRLLIDYCKANCGKIPDNEEVCPNCYAAQMIADAPIIAPASLRPKGEWENHPHALGFVRCSVCHDCNIWGEWADGKKWNFCPNCGADMRGEEDGN